MMRVLQIFAQPVLEKFDVIVVEDPEMVCKAFVFGANIRIVPLRTN